MHGHQGSSTDRAHTRPAFSESPVSSRRGARLELRRVPDAVLVYDGSGNGDVKGTGNVDTLVSSAEGVCRRPPSWLFMLDVLDEATTGSGVDRRKDHGLKGIESTLTVPRMAGCTPQSAAICRRDCIFKCSPILYVSVFLIGDKDSGKRRIQGACLNGAAGGF
jgi:hypothetical protein